MINLGWLKSGQGDAIHREMAVICEETGQTIKAILETALLTPSEIALAAEVCMDAGVAYLKTSTGWQGGATVEGGQGNFNTLPRAGLASKRPAEFAQRLKRWR